MLYDDYVLPDDSDKKCRHYKWSESEDAMLRRLVNKAKVPNWNTIAKRFHNRNARQCKDRWNYYLSPNVNNSEWTEEEDKLLFEKFEEFGTKWSAIAKFFNNRTNTNVKNRWLAIHRRSAQKSSKASSKEASDSTEKQSDEEKPQKENNDAFDSLFQEVIDQTISDTISMSFLPDVDLLSHGLSKNDSSMNDILMGSFAELW